MTEAKRITLNTLASYMKSIVTLPLNLLSARWVLAALGTDDFGLYGLVGGVVFFITFINAVSSQAVARFYAFSIGRAKTPHHEQDLKQWFNTALSIHVLLPAFVLVTGYPVGVYAINHWLVIPPDRTLLALRIFQIALAQAFFAMVIVPYVALYVAHQFITNLTVFTILTSVLNAALAFGLVHMEGGRVYVYAVGMLTISVLLGLAQVAYARRRFNDARVRFSMMFNWNRMREMLSFTWWRFLASCGWMLRTQGSGFVANSYCGVTANAAISVSNQLSAQTAAFSAHLVNAFMPAVVTSAGANQTGRTCVSRQQVQQFAGGALRDTDDFVLRRNPDAVAEKPSQ